MSESGEGREMTLEQLMDLRGKTDAISRWLRMELEDRLETLRPLLAPKLLLGDFLRSAEKLELKEAERNFDRLKEAYLTLAGGPLALRPKLDAPLEPIPNKLSLEPWEETYRPDGAEEVTLRSPVSWVLGYSPALKLSQARKMAAGQGDRNEPGLRGFVLQSLVMAAVFERNAGLSRLFAALRFQAETVQTPELGRLPLVRLTAPFPTFRPADPLLLQAVRLSGIPEFQELVDPEEAVSQIKDPLLTALGS